MSNNFRSRLVDYCRIDNAKLIEIIDLGLHPYADTFIGSTQLNLAEPLFPLVCMLCPECGLVQLKYETQDYERYNLYAYSYTSSNSDFSRSHWNDFAKYAVETSAKPIRNVVEIGSNDGYLLKQFHTKAVKVLGVDSSLEMATMANSKGIDTLHAVFNHESSHQVLDMMGEVDLVVANNVLNHANNPLNFIDGISDIMSKNGRFIFEVPYWKDTINSLHFDQIYHEHVTYFTAQSIEKLLRSAGLSVADISVVNYHGGSLRVTAVKATEHNAIAPLGSLIAGEYSDGLFEVETYRQYVSALKKNRNLFLMNIHQLMTESPKTPIAGIGAAAKANTLLTFYGLNNTYLKFVADSSSHKIGKYTPFTRIPICEDNEFKKYDKIYALVLSWNIGETLRTSIRAINSKVEFLKL